MPAPPTTSPATTPACICFPHLTHSDACISPTDDSRTSSTDDPRTSPADDFRTSPDGSHTSPKDDHQISPADITTPHQQMIPNPIFSLPPSDAYRLSVPPDRSPSKAPTKWRRFSMRYLTARVPALSAWSTACWGTTHFAQDCSS